MPANRDPAGMALRGLEEAGRIPERVVIFVGAKYLVAVAPAYSLHLHEALTRHGYDHAYAVRGVKHRRQAVPPVRKAALVKHDRDQPLVMIFRLGVHDGPELAGFIPLAARNHFRPVIAR